MSKFARRSTRSKWKARGGERSDDDGGDDPMPPAADARLSRDGKLTERTEPGEDEP